jgi:cobalt-zinc-cadmium efflux system outer membrane protein
MAFDMSFHRSADSRSSDVGSSRRAIFTMILALVPALFPAIAVAQAGGGAGGAAGASGAGAASAPNSPAGGQSGPPLPSAPNAQNPGQPPPGNLQFTAPSVIQPPPPVPALPTGPITMQQAVALARSSNPALLAAYQNLLSIQALEIQAGVRQNPYLGVTGSNLTLGPSADNPYAFGIGVGRLFERGEKRRYRVDSARSTTAQTNAQYRNSEQQTIFDVREAFTNLIIAKAARKLADDNLNDFKRELDIAKDRLDAGDLAKLDYERIDLQFAQFETDESTAIVNAEQASIQLQTLIGLAKPSPAFDIVGDPVPPALTLSMDDLEQKGLAARADFRAAQAAVALAEANLKLAYANGTADPTLEADYNRNGNDNSVGFSLNIPLRFFDKNQGNKASASFSVESARLSVTSTRNQVVSDIDSAYSGYINSKLLADRYNGHYLDESKDVLDIAKFSYDHGGLALIDYLDAVRDSRAVNSDALNAYSQTWLAIHQLSFVTATDIAP